MKLIQKKENIKMGFDRKFTFWLEGPNGSTLKTKDFAEILAGMEEMLILWKGKTRNQYMHERNAVGFFDDSDCTFYREMKALGMRTGVVKTDGSFVEVDAFADNFWSKDEFGD